MVLAYKDRCLNPGYYQKSLQFLDPRERVITIIPLIFVRPSVRASVRLSFVIKIITTSPSKLLNGLSSNF